MGQVASFTVWEGVQYIHVIRVCTTVQYSSTCNKHVLVVIQRRERLLTDVRDNSPRRVATKVESKNGQQQ